MASSGALAEFARLPTERKVMVFAVIGLLLGLGYWKLIYKPLADEVDAAQAEHDSKVQTSRRLAADLPKYEELRSRMAKLRVLIEQNQTALPSEAEVPAFFETLQHKVAESGVEIRKWSNRSQEQVESFWKVPVEVEMTGSFMQIKRFFASLIQKDVRLSQGPQDEASEEPERVVSIENLSLSSPTVRNREIILTAKFTAVTFRQEEKPAAPDKAGGPMVAPGGRPAPSPLAAPASPAPATAPPPMPSAASPAAVKARVENSVETGAARTRDAVGSGDRLKGGL